MNDGKLAVRPAHVSTMAPALAVASLPNTRQRMTKTPKRQWGNQGTKKDSKKQNKSSPFELCLQHGHKGLYNVAL